MKREPSDLIILEEFKEKHYGMVGSAKRNELEMGFESFLIGHLIMEARLQKGLTKQQLAEKVGTSTLNISRIENNVSKVPLSTLKRIIEAGLGGKLSVTIEF